MDIISEPDYLEEPVRYLDIVYVGGGTDSITLKAEDDIKVLSEARPHLRIAIKHPPEQIVCELRNVCCWRVRAGVMRTKKPKDAPKPPAVSEPKYSQAEFHSHRPTCASRTGGGFDPRACNCDASSSEKRDGNGLLPNEYRIK